MKRLLTSVFTLLLVAPVSAQDTPAGLSLRGDNGDEIDVSAGDDSAADGAEADISATQDEDSGDVEEPAGTSEQTGVAADETDAATDAAIDAAAEDADQTNDGIAGDETDVDAATAADAGDGLDVSAEPDGTAPASDEADSDATDAFTEETDDVATGEENTAPADDDVLSENADDTDAGEPAEAETGDDTASANIAVHSLSPATPFIDSSEYAALRPASEGEPLRLVWSIQRETADGESVGEPVTRTLVIAPDFVRDESSSEISVYDFLADRHLEIDAGSGTLTNTAFAAEVRRRLDTYLGLSQGGRLDDIPLGPDTSFDRFWLEAAMGIRRAPATLTLTYENGALTVARAGGLNILSAQFATESEAASPPEDAAIEDESGEADTDGPTDIDLAAMPIDLSSGESVVFDPSQAASPINLNLNDNAVSYPDGDPAEQAQAEMLRRWMRHALPIHPDALGALEGAPRIPDAFAFFIISPESPEGRREIWTLQSVEPIEPGLRLEEALAPAFNEGTLIANRLVPAARAALGSDETVDQQDFLDEIGDHSAAGDHVRAYLASLQEQNHNGACPPAAQAATRPVCGEVSGLIAAGLGDPAFESLFGLIAGPVGTGNEAMVETLQPYLADNGLAGAAARTLTAKALLAWAARDPEGPPEGLSPYELFAEAIEIDPLASGVWWEIGNALLVARDPLSGWTVFDTGRALLPPDAPGLLVQVEALEDRLRTLAPEFFLPR
jgi:hypothetical protein